MLTRAITGIFFVMALLTALYFGNISTFFLFLVITTLGIEEFYSINSKNKEIQPHTFLGILSSIIIISSFALVLSNKIPYKYLSVSLIFLFSPFIIELFRNSKKPFINISYTIFGVFYVTLPFLLLYHIGYYQNNQFLSGFNFSTIWGYFFILWANDTGAYLSGKYLGKHKLFERISPKKTWEGSFGGAALSIVTAYFLSIYYTQLSQSEWIIIAIITVVFGSLGDLVESMLKRSLNIKDSGTILPGHGGILDRFDGLFLSVPFVYAYLVLIS